MEQKSGKLGTLLLLFLISGTLPLFWKISNNLLNFEVSMYNWGKKKFFLSDLFGEMRNAQVPENKLCAEVYKSWFTRLGKTRNLRGGKDVDLCKTLFVLEHTMECRKEREEKKLEA